MKRVLSIEKHELSKQRLDVRPYYPSFGVLPPGFDSSVPRQPLPDELVVECEPEVVGFLFKSKQVKHKVQWGDLICSFFLLEDRPII